MVGAEPESEDDQRDEDQRSQDSTRPGAALTRRVQPALEEDEDRDRRQEPEPVGRPRLPEQRPVDRVAVHERTQHERDVHAESETRYVRGDEREHAERAAHEADERAT